MKVITHTPIGVCVVVLLSLPEYLTQGVEGDVVAEMVVELSRGPVTDRGPTHCRNSRSAYVQQHGLREPDPDPSHRM